jgi:Ca2+-binding EF-hand superfamily protein
VDDTMQKGDKDQDGKLSYHEFINMMQEQRDYRNRVNQRDAELRKSV